MILLPAHAEPAANAGTGPEGHRRTSSVDSGASSDATIVVASIDGIDGAIDGSHKSVATGKLLTSPPVPSNERAAGDPELAAHDAKRGRVSTDTASGAPALATHTTTAGSPTAAAPITVSSYTATTFAVADHNADALKEPSEASDGGHHEPAPAHGAPAAAFCAAAGATAPSSDEQDDDAVPGPTASASGATVGLSLVDHGGPAQARASATTGAAGGLGAAASESATIDANPTSRGDAGSPETPVISRRPRAVPTRAFCIGRTATPAPAPPAGGSKSAVIVANATSRGGAHCPPTPVVSRLSMPRSHAIPGAAVPAVPVNSGQSNAFCIGRRSAAASTAAPAASPTPVTTAAIPPALAPPPTVSLMPATATSSRLQPQSSPARFSALCTVSRAIRRGMDAIRNALIVLRNRDIRPTNEHRLTSPGYGRAERNDARRDEDAPGDAALLELFNRQRRRLL